MMVYRLAKDVVIPAGTEIYVDPAGTTAMWPGDRASIFIEVTKDVTAEWCMELEEGLQTGLIVGEPDP